MRSKRSVNGLVLAGTVALLVVLAPSAEVGAAAGDCGIPSSGSTTPMASDALFILKEAVAPVKSCDLCVCDVNSDGGISAVDALIVLKKAVGQSVSLACVACASNDCFFSSAPSCGGDCPLGEVCARDPFDPEFCECLTPCETDSAPACGSDCGDLVGLTCQVLSVSISGMSPLTTCECAAPGLQACADSSSSGCDGVCGNGQACNDDGLGGCICQTLPTQGPCAEAIAPQCGGTCTEGFICEDTGSGCGCVDFSGTESCEEGDDYPLCGGACADGLFCAAGILGECECLDLCELSDAPACGGACSDPGASCVPGTGTIGGVAIGFCLCSGGMTSTTSTTHPPVTSTTTTTTTVPVVYTCFDAAVPTCGGTCPPGLTCAEDPLDPGFCECLTGCEISAAPSCGGDCNNDPGVTCQVLSIAAGGGPAQEQCICAAPGVQDCPSSAGTGCDGLCSPGGACASDGMGGCVCQALPVQGPCSGASPPQCGGTCGVGMVCRDTGGGCACQNFTGFDTCAGADYPSCGGACPDNFLCAADTLGFCECLSPCEIGQAPSCGGECLAVGESCIPATATLGGGSLELCLCN
ncbi:MAG: hypothetical protein ACE5E4_09020 [Candidatus Binatia bacterium]